MFKKPFETYSGLKPNRDGDSSYTLAGTVQSNPIILSPVAHSTQRSRWDNEDEDDLVALIQSLNRQVATLGALIVENLFPPATSCLQRNRRALLDPPLFGAEENYSFSTMQINITPLTHRNLSSLGYSGTSHIDRHDDPMSLTVLICVSHLKPGTYPGNFYMGETREWCELKPFSVLIFRGTGPHGGTQAIAPGEPDEHEKRINLILYPRREFVNRTLPILYPCYLEQQLADYSFFADGAACFGSDKYRKSWCRRELFRHMMTTNKKYGLEVEDANLQRAFTAVTGSTNRYIDPESPEGLGITKSITQANQIMESIRPRWKDVKSAPKRKSAEFEDPSQGTTARKRTMPLSASRETALASTTQYQQDTAASRRSTRASSAQQSQLPSTIQTPPEAVAPKRIRSSTVHLEGVRTLSLQASQRSTESSTSQKGRSTSMVRSTESVQASGSMWTRNQKTVNSCNDAEMAESHVSDDRLSESDEAYIPEQNESISDLTNGDDDMDEDSDTPYANTGDIATSDVEIHNETTALISGGPIVASNRSPPLAEILQRMPLFNISTMNLEWESILNRAKLLRSQVSKRSPQTSLFLPKPSSLPLPKTDGLTLVEQLIQLGERCQWITQKFEHLWFYERALEEHFFFTLLRVEPLFDIAELTSLFKNKNRNNGAGICSHVVMDKVTLMVNKMIRKAKCSDDTEEEFTFDAVEILNRQYQPKFCVSVEVALRPYRGRDPYAHMAHHFREVCTIYFEA